MNLQCFECHGRFQAILQTADIQRHVAGPADGQAHAMPIVLSLFHRQFLLFTPGSGLRFMGEAYT